MNHCIKTKGKRMTALFLVLVLALSMFSTTAFAAQEDNYHDPAEHWLSAVNRTNELDVNATVTREKLCRLRSVHHLHHLSDAGIYPQR